MMFNRCCAKSNNFSKHGDVVEHKVAHIVVFGVKNELAVAPDKALHRRAVVNKRNNNVAVVGGVLLFINDFIAVEPYRF